MVNLQTALSNELWVVIESSYERQAYSVALLDAMHLISETIRNRAGIDGDGVQLAGAALGGATPPLRITGLRTETEKSVQKGFHNIILGLYQAIRNPRSHQPYSDSKQDADAILLFLDFLYRTLASAKSPYDQRDFVAKVLDPIFPDDYEYARLLVGEVPPGKRLDLAVTVLQKSEDSRPTAARLFFDCCFAVLEPDEKQTLLNYFVEDLRSAGSDQEILRLLRILPARLWGSVPSICRRRIEHRLLRAVSSGCLHHRSGKLLDGEVGLCLVDIYKDVELREEMVGCFRNILESENISRISYLCKHFSKVLVDLDPELRVFGVSGIIEALNARSAVVYYGLQWLHGEAPTSSWRKALEKSLKSFQFMDDDIPF